MAPTIATVLPAASVFSTFALWNVASVIVAVITIGVDTPAAAVVGVPDAVIGGGAACTLTAVTNKHTNANSELCDALMVCSTRRANRFDARRRGRWLSVMAHTRQLNAPVAGRARGRPSA